ncbi:MAG TPA: HEAT repeat domain-containing protein [Polyangia bacterium]|nr:HEAT repeat domain-containing protein [Polyangia bacterium]
MRRLLGMLLVVATGASLVACGDVTPEKIARWKETERGPGKLRDAVKSSSLSPSLRAQALVALVELGMSADAIAELETRPSVDRAPVVHEAAPRLGQLAGTGADVTTTRVQREAKDAMFLLRADAAPADRDALDDLLIAWTCADLNGRMSLGGQSSDKILTAIGARATPRLIALLSTEGPNQQQAAAILAKIGDAPTRARAVDALVESAKKLQQRTRDVPDGLLQSIGVLGGPHATAYLVEVAERGSESLRERALFALAQGGAGLDSSALAAAERIAGDKKAPGKVREAAFQVAEKIGASAVPAMVRLMNDADETVRWRAVEAALAAGKDKAVAPVLEALSQSRPYKKEDLDSYVVHDLGLIGAGALEPLKGELKSKSWVARIVAVRGIAAVGKAEDAPAVAALESDGTKLKGFAGSATIGSEAKAAEQALRAKR